MSVRRGSLSLRQACHSRQSRPSSSSRGLSSSRHLSQSQASALAADRAGHDGPERLPRHHNGSKENDKLATRDLFLSVLGATTTKRDAKAYLSQFGPQQSPTATAAATVRTRVALLKIRSLQTLDAPTVDGIATTISQLNRLGMRCVVVLDCTPDEPPSTAAALEPSRAAASAQADRLVAALEAVAATQAARLDDLFSLGAAPAANDAPAVEVQFPELLARTLRRSVIPVVPAAAFSTDTQRRAAADPDAAVLALARALARAPAHQLDRVVLLDPAGALPSAKRADRTHVFVNMEQEFDDIRAELRAGGAPLAARHARNLSLLRAALALLPASSSALLAAPAAVATPAPPERSTLDVRTRRPRNPLIFTLLTDKPLVASSLPAARRPHGAAPAAEAPPPSVVTFAKHGMPLAIIPDARHGPWAPPADGAPPRVSLTGSPTIDFARLRALIDDSFGRRLDAARYVARVGPRLAGVILAGRLHPPSSASPPTFSPSHSQDSSDGAGAPAAAYEGAAILTYEPAPSGARPIPYLDKFAVRRASQGAGGVADMLFGAMVRSCFPAGVVWRSRADNPANGWYFERAAGSWRLPGTGWTMFWTEEGLERDAARFADCVAVCRGVEPSWLE